MLLLCSYNAFAALCDIVSVSRGNEEPAQGQHKRGVEYSRIYVRGLRDLVAGKGL